ncbi:hypothetical protein ES705_49121 [subsurface metagenome]
MNKYLIIIEKADGNYSSYSPDLPGCIAVGDTVEETRDKMKSAINFHIEGLRAEGLTVPNPEAISEYIAV